MTEPRRHFQLDAGDPGGAIGSYRESLQLAIDHQDPHREARAYHHLGAALIQAGLTAEAIHPLTLALGNYEKLIDPTAAKVAQLLESL